MKRKWPKDDTMDNTHPNDQMDVDTQSTPPAPELQRRLIIQSWLDSSEGKALEASLATNDSTFFKISCGYLTSKLKSPIKEAILGDNGNKVLGLEFERWKDMKLIDILLTGFVDLSAKDRANVPETPTDGLNIGTLDSFKAATVQSWSQDFVGDAHQRLWAYVCKYYPPSVANIYARYLVIFNSSGLGKSRALDEISKEHFTIPLCLRGEGTTGFPPSDDTVRDYLLGPKKFRTNGMRYVGSWEEPVEAYVAYLALFKALFERVAEILEGEDFKNLSYVECAARFRRLMTEGMTMHGHNEYRKAFYDEVVQLAESRSIDKESVLKDGKLISGSPTRPPRTKSAAPKESKPDQGSHKAPDDGTATDGVQDACSTLWGILLRRAGASEEASVQGPLVLLTFDEAHELAHRPQDIPWTRFIQLRTVLRVLNNESIFSIFLSTTGKFSQFTPASVNDASARVSQQLLTLIPPFCDLGLDVLIKDRPELKISLNGDWTLEKVTKDEYMCQLGRPLFGGQYRAQNRDVRKYLVYFAAQKLLNHQPGLPKTFTDSQILACLSFRLPIEFVSTVYESRDIEMAQVEGHLRICLKALPDQETMTTVSASEPFLSEASYVALDQAGGNRAVQVFRQYTSGFCVSAGDRGEFVVMLLLTLARDACVGRPVVYQPKSRIFLVRDLLNNHLMKSSSNIQSCLEALADDFPTASMHFNHFVRLHEQKAIDRDCLLLLLGRGAGIMCAPNQAAVDLILPFLLGGGDGFKLVASNLGLILIQVKNNSRYGFNVKAWLFDSMDPYKIGILRPGDKPVPMIRIVFALASPKPGIKIFKHKPTKKYNAVVYDIWIAGLSPEFLHHIETAGQDMWEAILHASHPWRSIYVDSLDETKMNPIRQSANPAAALDEAHWRNWCEPPRATTDGQEM